MSVLGLAWGQNNYGQLGNGNADSKNTPVAIFLNSPSSFSKSALSEHGLAIDSTGMVWAYGWNYWGQLGTGDTNDRSFPVAIARSDSYTVVAAGAAHSLALDSSGMIWSWGLNEYGQLGTGNIDNESSPVSIARFDSYVAISAGEEHSLAIDSSGMIWSWGYNNHGQLGNDSTDNQSIPVSIARSGNYIAISAGAAHSLAIDSSGVAWAWGFNSDGQLGTNNINSQSSPVSIARSGSYIAISAGVAHSMTIDSSGMVWAWGHNGNGEIGNDSTNSRSSPISIARSSSYTAIAAGRYHSLAIDSSMIWAWGSNGYGELGTGDTGNRSSPISIARTGNYMTLGVAGSSSYGLSNTQISIAGDGHGTTVPSGIISLNVGDTTSISATPLPGYNFLNWTTPSGHASFADASSASTIVTLLDLNDAEIQANFYSYWLTISNDGHGTTAPSGTIPVNTGEETAISATLSYGYIFLDWTVPSGSASITDPTAPSTTVALTSSDATVQANFEAVPTSGLTVNSTLILNGNATVNGEILVTPKGTIIPVPDPDLKKTFYSYRTNSYITSNGQGRTITSLTGDIIIQGLISGVGQGFESDRGPGTNSAQIDSSGNKLDGYGASHAGLGYISMPGAPKPVHTYGNHETPVSLGSGSGYYHPWSDFFGTETRGGGAIKLVAQSGNISVNGRINMNGQDGANTGGASGGSAWLYGWNIDGSGSITSEGGTTYLPANSGGGGGGYIALWHDHTNSFDGALSVSGKAGGGPGKIFTKQTEPIFEENFTGNIWNTKWWDYSGNVSLSNAVTLTSPTGTATPYVESLFTISGKNITASIDYIPSGPEIANYSINFLLKADSDNWFGIARKPTGFFGISDATGVIDSFGVPFDYTNVTFKVIKTDSTFLFQFYDATSVPQTIYTDVRPDLANETFKVFLNISKVGSNQIAGTFDSLKIYNGVINHAETMEPVIYVDSNIGSDSSSGLPLSPMKNLFVASAWAKKGGMVVLYDGTYNPTSIKRKDLTIRGAEGVKPLVTSRYVQDTTGSGWEANALSFYGCQGRVENVQIADSSVGIRIENTELFDVSRNLIYDVTTGVQVINCDPVVMRNKIYDSSVAIDCSNSWDPYIYSNVIYDSSVGVHAGHVKDFQIVGNTIDSCEVAVMADGSSSGLVSSNNLTDSSTGFQLSLDSSAGSYYNNYYGDTTVYSRTPDAVIGDFIADPAYVDSGNYHLTGSSADIHAGQSTYDDYMIDFDGASRVDSSNNPDVGAYAYIHGSHTGDYYVAGNGDDYRNFGGLNDPFRTLDKAMSVADSTIHIAGGHYDSYFLQLKSEGIIFDSPFALYNPSLNLLLYYTITSKDLLKGYICLPAILTPADCSTITVAIVGGFPLQLGTDYTLETIDWFSGTHLKWAGYALEPLLSVGSVLRVNIVGGYLQRKFLNFVIHGHHSNINRGGALFVSPNGSDSTVIGGDGTNTGGNGSYTLPYRTITKALSVSSPEDYIIALAGDYPIFNGLDNRALVGTMDRTSSTDKTSRRFYEDLFMPMDFRAYGTTEYDSVPWDFTYAGNSYVNSGGGFLNFTYDGINSAIADASFKIVNDFEVSATLRDVLDPLKFSITNTDSTAYFILNGSDYTSGVYTGGSSYWADGSIAAGALPNRFVTEYIAITANDIRNKAVSLTFIPESDTSNTSLNIVGGVAQNYAEDYYIKDSKIKWDGMTLDGELQAGDVLRVIYLDKRLSDPVRVQITLKDTLFTIKYYDTAWHRAMMKNMDATYHGPWNISFFMDQSNAVNHDNIFGKGFVSEFSAIGESFVDLSVDQDYKYKTERKALTISNDRPLAITTGSTLISGVDGTHYRARFDASGGYSLMGMPVTWSWEVSSGTIPTGLTFQDKQVYALLDGTPAVPGNYLFTVTLNDAGSRESSVSKNFSLSII